MEVNVNREVSLEPEKDFYCSLRTILNNGVYTEHSDIGVGVQMYSSYLIMFFICKAIAVCNSNVSFFFI